MIKKQVSNNLIYLDACATTPLHPEVIEHLNFININYWGNPSSLHSHGINSAEILERSRFSIAKKLDCHFEEVIFTSGATESVHLAIKGIAKSLSPGRIVISSVEHPAVNSAAESLKLSGWDIVKWPVDSKGNILIDLADRFLTTPTKIVSIIWGQSEIGSVQPIREIGDICKKNNIYFHTDATQILPHSSIEFRKLPVDLLSISAHKFLGPKGIGLLLVKRNIKDVLQPIQGGGSQEFGLRSGTESVPLISGMAMAMKFINKQIYFDKTNTFFKTSYVSKQTKILVNLLSEIDELIFVGNGFNINRLPNHVSLIARNKAGFPIPSRDFVKQLAQKGISISSGSACSSGTNKESPILKALGFDKKLLKSGIRISLGPWIDYNQIKYVSQMIKDTIKKFN